MIIFGVAEGEECLYQMIGYCHFEENHAARNDG